MIWGIIAGFSTALLNSAGYLFSARFLYYYKDPVRLLVMASLVMMTVSLPFALWLFPFSQIPELSTYILEAVASALLFLVGQGAFFAALRFFEASRLSSLLGLKIIVLSCIFIISGGMLNFSQITAVIMAAAAALIFNWSGAGKSSWKGWLCLLMTLICYSSVDILETDLVVTVKENTTYSVMYSSLVVVMLLYSVVGMIMLPALFFFKPERDQLIKAAPYGLLWLSSQVTILCCYAFLQPVFGNVILATRGIFSVIAGALLPYFGLAAFDSRIPLRLWVRRIIAAVVMLGAIALYSFGSIK